ncbi:hypothetical protein TruAng_010184 [Truncatella angustata]|nr:hypothetical protein TruAng_010184 [Truncatella angustata]
MLGKGGYKSDLRTYNYSQVSSAGYQQTPDFVKYPKPSTSMLSTSSTRSDIPLRIQSNQKIAGSREYNSISPVSQNLNTRYPPRKSQANQQRSLRRSSQLTISSKPTAASKSVSFNPEQVLPEDNEEGYHTSLRSDSLNLPSPMRSTTTNDTTLSLQRAFIGNAKRAWRIWDNLITTWGPALILIVILVAAVYYGCTIILDIVQLVRQLGWQLCSSFESLKHDAESQMGLPFRLNFTAEFRPIWDQYSNILENTEYERWFNDARDAEDVISALWNTLPYEKADDIQKQEHTKMKGYTDYRMALRKRAEVKFENFLLARTRVIQDILNVSHDWSGYVRSTLQLNHSVTPRAHEAIFGVRTMERQERNDHWQLQNQTSCLLNYATRGLLNSISEMHKGLYVSRETTNTISGSDATSLDWLKSPPRKDGDEGIKLFTLGDIISAQELEAKFMDNLVKQSIHPHLWDSGRLHSTSLGRLRVRLTGLQKDLDDIEVKLTKLRARIDDNTASQTWEPANKVPWTRKDDLIWVQNVDELLSTWNNMLNDVDRAKVNAVERFNQLKLDEQNSKNRDKLAHWRTENCGETTCFDVVPERTWGDLVKAGQHRLRFAGSKEGRKPFAKIPVKVERELFNHMGEVTSARKHMAGPA